MIREDSLKRGLEIRLDRGKILGAFIRKPASDLKVGVGGQETLFLNWPRANDLDAMNLDSDEFQGGDLVDGHGRRRDRRAPREHERDATKKRTNPRAENGLPYHGCSPASLRKLRPPELARAGASIILYA
ncbi:MAG: hypothetical protein JO068_02790 [Hyphomicrobiales bacterium]|nr:hypothetical protein [Hyphomicrobiales bacterium]